jgi:5-methylcytosine-specific restriction endonuclease McrA
MSTRKRLYDFIAKKGPGKYKSKTLQDVGIRSEWARTLRQLKQDGVFEFNYSQIEKTYDIRSINEYTATSKRAGLSNKDKFRISNRDGHRCQACGKGVCDGVKLVIDHKTPLDCGGGHNDANLWTLCESCNGGKQAFFKDDLDTEVMKKVFAEKSGLQKLKVLFENSPGKKYTPAILQGISGIRDWTRTVRSIREKHCPNLKWVAKECNFPDGYYVNVE